MPKPKTVFNHVDAIYTDKSPDYFDELDVKSRASYTPYMVNRIVSMNPQHLPIVNEIQKYTKLPIEMHYLFLADITPRRKQYNKYIKAAKHAYPDWLITLLQTHFEVSQREILDYLGIFFQDREQYAGLVGILCRYGIEQTEIDTLHKFLGDV